MEAVLAKISELEAQNTNVLDEETSALLKAAESVPGTDTLRAKIQQQGKLVRTLKTENGALNKRLTAATAEIESLTVEVRKLNSVKERLETLCRELQTRNKALALAEEQTRAQEAQNRQELTTKFQGLVDEFTKRMETHMAETKLVTEENQKLRQDLITLHQQNEILVRAQATLTQQKDLELKLSELKIAEQFKQFEDLAATKLELAKSKMVEAELNARLEDYGSKYDSLRKSVSESTAFFEDFKKHREDMDKKLKGLVKERDTFAKKCVSMEKTIISMADEKLKADAQLESVQTQKDKLQGLCRALQMERNELRKDLAVATSASSAPSSAPVEGEEPTPDSLPE